VGARPFGVCTLLYVSCLFWLRRQSLPWETVQLKQQPCGLPVTGRFCRLPDEPHHAEQVHAATWTWKGAAHNYRVRQRLGWPHLRDMLARVSCNRVHSKGGTTRSCQEANLLGVSC
jgi:hypothetical protein